MEIDVKNIKAAYKTATESEKTLLYILFPELHLGEEQPRPVTERIKTFEDACEELGNDNPMIQAWNSIYQGCEDWSQDKDIADVIAYHKLRIITASLNEGWQPQFTQEEERWYPWFCLWTDDELEDNGIEWEKQHALLSFDAYQGDWGGFASAISHSAPSSTAANFGSRLCYKSEALADYSGRQFADLWADFYLIRK